MPDRIIELQDLLLTHLITRFSGLNAQPGKPIRNWIYPDQPRVDAKKPRIGIEVPSIQDRPLETGPSKGRTNTAGVTIDIYTDSQFIYSANGVQYSGTLLRDYLADLVHSEVVFATSSLWRSASITDVRQIGGTLFPYNENDDIYRRQVRYSFEINK